MSTTEGFDWNAAENELRYIGDGDLIFKWGRFSVPEWHFIGIPGTNFGVSYYFATGNEDATQYRRLVNLVDGKK